MDLSRYLAAARQGSVNAFDALRLCKDSPSPPPAPDYAGAAKAQGQANLDAARATAKLNNPNIINPYGTQTVTYGGGAPTFNQSGYDAALKAYQGGGAAGSGEGTWSTLPDGSPVFNMPSGGGGAAPNQADYWMNSGDPDIPTVTQKLSPEQQALYDKRMQAQSNLGDLSITGSEALKGIVGKGVDFSGAPVTQDYEGTRNKVIQAMMTRANEDYGKSTDQANSNLIASGIRPGTKAYADKMQMIERARTDANAQAEVAGGNAAAQAYGMDADRRKQAITEYLAQRQTPLNEINALMSGSQVANPFAGAIGYQGGANVQPAPTFAATQAQAGAQNNIYNADVASSNAQTQGLTALAGAAISAFF